MTDQIDKNYKNETEKEHAIRDALDLQTVSSAHNNTLNVLLLKYVFALNSSIRTLRVRSKRKCRFL